MERVSTRPTKADVARLANVSTATVSYVLNNSPGRRISTETKAAVRRAAEQLGYRPNLAARSLAVGASGVVLFVVPRWISDNLLTEVGSRLTSALLQHGIVLSMQFETQDNRNVIAAITDLNPIAVTSVFPLTGAVADVVTEAGIPQIHLGGPDPEGFGSLSMGVGAMRVGHLVDRGHRRLGFALSGSAGLDSLGRYWLAGARGAAAERGLPEISVATLADDGSDAADIVARWVGEGVTAVLAQSDEMGFVVLHGIRRAGLRCPQDLAVIGVNTGLLGGVSAPALTSVAFDAGVIVEVAARAFSSALAVPIGKAPIVNNAEEQPLYSLVIRESA